jgi:hypothetical protein
VAAVLFTSVHDERVKDSNRGTDCTLSFGLVSVHYLHGEMSLAAPRVYGTAGKAVFVESRFNSFKIFCGRGTGLGSPDFLIGASNGFAHALSGNGVRCEIAWKD